MESTDTPSSRPVTATRDAEAVVRSTNTSLSLSRSSTSSRLARPLSASITTTRTGTGIRRPARVPASVHEGDSNRDTSRGKLNVQSSIRPPSSQSHLAASTPLRRSQLSRSTSSRTGHTVPDSPSTVRPKDRTLGSTKLATGLAAAPTNRRIVPAASHQQSTVRGVEPVLVESPRKARDGIGSTLSSARRNSSSSSNPTPSISSTHPRDRRSSSTKSDYAHRDSPLKKSTKVNQGRVARRIPLPALSSSSSSSSIPVFASSVSASSRSNLPRETIARQKGNDRIGLGPPPPSASGGGGGGGGGGGTARRVSVTNARLGGGIAKRHGTINGTVKRATSNLRTSILPESADKEEEQQEEVDERTPTRRRIGKRESSSDGTGRNRRESWETVVGDGTATRSRSTSIASSSSTTSTWKAPGSTLPRRLSTSTVTKPPSVRHGGAVRTRPNGFSTTTTPSKPAPPSTSPRYHAILFTSPPSASSLSDSLPSSRKPHLDSLRPCPSTNPTPLENRQLSLLRTSSSSSSTSPSALPSDDPTSTSFSSSQAQTPRVGLQQRQRAARAPRGSTTLEELLENGLFSSPLLPPRTTTTNSLSNSCTGPSCSSSSLSNSTPIRTTTGRGEFEFLMDEEGSRIMFEEIKNASNSIATTPWRGRVVSLSMSASGSGRRGGRGGGRVEGDGSFEFQGDRRNRDGTEIIEGLRDGGTTEEEEEEEAGEGEGEFERSREVLVLQRVDDDAQELDRLRTEKEALEKELEEVKKERGDVEARTREEVKERYERELEEKRKEWDHEKREFEQTLEALDSTRGTRLDFVALETTTAYSASQTYYEQVESAAAREKEELMGALEALKLIGKGLEVWQAV